ncbi:BON domain-containing protein [Natronospora cellulosivora (SeqCode)]
MQATIDSDRNVGPYGLKVEEGEKLINVTGVVDTLDEVNYTKKLVKDLNPNKKLEMAVSISTDGAITDNDSEMEVAEEIADNSELSDNINIRVDKGKVTLSGRVENEELKKEAANVAAKARGVIDVVNDIEVQSFDRNENYDDIFHSQVRNDDD